MARGSTNALGKLPIIVNPNLLDNWYFGNPVNQREQTSYTTSGYTIDRWRTWRDGDIVVTENGMKISTQLYQYSEIFAYIAGKVATLSILLLDGYLASGTFYAFMGADNKVYINHGGIESIEIYKTTNYTVRINPVTGGTQSDEIVAVKLELGDTQTLARQEANGTWVLNEIPNYGEQLARCQRYCYILDGTHKVFAGRSGNADTTIAFSIPTPVRMRANPVITFVEDNSVFKLAIAGYPTITVDSIMARNGGVDIIATSPTGTGSVRTTVNVATQTSVILSADL